MGRYIKSQTEERSTAVRETDRTKYSDRETDTRTEIH